MRNQLNVTTYTSRNKEALQFTVNRTESSGGFVKAACVIDHDVTVEFMTVYVSYHVINDEIIAK